MLMRRVEKTIARLFLHNGYKRIASSERKEGHGAAYKKGHELRFVLDRGEDPEELTGMLASLGISAGKPYHRSQRAQQWIVPVYGKDPVELILSWTAEVELAAKQAAVKKARAKRAGA